MPTLLEYIDEQGRSPFGRWLAELTALAALKVRTALARLEAGNTSAVKSVGGGVHELRVDFGPGYRVYLASTPDFVILLGGSAMARQSAAIAGAQGRWNDYRRCKRRRDLE
jgi:putative addiction module killer protein